MRLNTSILGPVLVGVCIVILAQNTGQVQGLTCIDCADFVINGSAAGAIVTPVLNAIPGIRDRNCRTATAQSNIDMTTCPSNPTSGDRVYRCGAYTGTLNVVGPLNIFDIPVHIIDRECVLVYKGLNDGCHPQSFAQQDAATFQKIFERLDSLGAVTFRGSICLSGDVSAASSIHIAHSLVISIVACFLYMLFSLS
ncbi:uncharacterized protein LOC110443600 [Mizuhopecten yessoensis]|uniref:Uncharacterized protein n=1 Tax=Mizuhopecten yessoensis TaxID=6573 RepID=A0A210PEL4_MIZYE|nr:uncharacterized protein LOC110443600 [Mizuhopecten yessoensis]OWF34901.1 hypothetical protein KP79_PYT08693 [Mizuhopecten yessoensis]